MPELPEVETARRNIEKAARGKKILSASGDITDKIVYDLQPAKSVVKALIGATIKKASRKGKYLWLEFDRRPWLILHLGMSGDIKIRNKTQDWSGIHLKGLKKSKTGKSENPKFCRLLFTFKDGTEIAFTDPRRFGRIRLVNDPKTERPISDLGMDPLDHFPPAKELHALLSKRKAPIKATLLDQSVFAGVGNWVADEILFQAGIDPHRRTNHLSLIEVTRLRKVLLAVLKKAVAVSADSEKYPDTWLFHHRWGKGKLAVTSKGDAIQFDTVGGRTTAWVPTRQS